MNLPFNAEEHGKNIDTKGLFRYNNLIVTVSLLYHVI